MFTLFKSNRTLRQLILNGNYVQSYATELIYQKKKKMNILNNNHNSEIKVRLCISANYVKYIWINVYWLIILVLNSTVIKKIKMAIVLLTV